MPNLKQLVINENGNICDAESKKEIKAEKIGKPKIDECYKSFTLVPLEFLMRFNPEKRTVIPDKADSYMILDFKGDDNFIVSTVQFYKTLP